MDVKRLWDVCRCGAMSGDHLCRWSRVCFTGTWWSVAGMNNGRSLWRLETRIPHRSQVKLTTLSYLRVSSNLCSCFYCSVDLKCAFPSSLAFQLMHIFGLILRLLLLQIWTHTTLRNVWWRMKTLCWCQLRPGTSCCPGMGWWRVSRRWNARYAHQAQQANKVSTCSMLTVCVCVCQVVDLPSTVKVEVYPIELFLCLHCNMENVLTSQFSRTDNICESAPAPW